MNSENASPMPVTEPKPTPVHVAAMLDLWRENGEKHWYRVTGTSMLPAIHDGDRVLVSYGLENLQRGEVVLFFENEGLVAHRVIQILRDPATEDYVLYTKGDNRNSFDSPVSVRHLLGRALEVQGANRRVRLDTRRARFAGWVVAELTFHISRVYGTARTLKHRQIGEGQLPGTHQAHHISTATIGTLLKLLGIRS